MSRILFVFLIFFVSVSVFAQRSGGRGSRKISANSRKARSEESAFAGTQVWLGLKGGINFAKAIPTERYSVFTSIIDPEQDKTYEKSYDGFGKIGFQGGMVFNFNFRRYLTLSFQPAYTSFRFGYKNEYKWTGQNNNSVQLNETHRITVDYLELPLLLRFDILRKRFRPYLQGGAYYGMLLKANKTKEVSSQDNASGAVNPLANTNPALDVRNLFIRSNWGWVAGLGFNYDVGNVRLGLDGLYKIGMNNVTSEKNRYSDPRFTSAGEVLDGFKFQNIEVSFSVIFPMKYLQTGIFKRVNP
jgi:hypothetical protein